MGKVLSCNVNNCYKCCRYFHTKKKWIHLTTFTKFCFNGSVECINCKYSNQKFKTSYQNNHKHNFSKCSVYLKLKASEIKKEYRLRTQ